MYNFHNLLLWISTKKKQKNLMDFFQKIYQQLCPIVFYIVWMVMNGLSATSEQKFPPKNYDNRESGVHGRPQIVNVTVWIESIVNIDVSAMEYVVHGYVIQEWHDARLANILQHDMILSRSDIVNIWLPDIYCLSCRSSTLNSPRQSNVLVKVFPNGTVYYSQLAKLHSSCFMKLHNFPFDAQTCPLNLSSFGYDENHLRYYWKEPPMVEKMTLEQFVVNENVVTHSEIKSFPAGNFTIVSFELYFTRQIGFYILQVYIPSAVLVSLSWMTFFMEAADIGDRLSIGVTLILTMIFLLGYINQSLPKVSYIKAVDWYVVASLFMIVSSVIESVTVYWLLHRTQKKEKKKEENSFEKFDQYLDKKFQNSMNFMPFINTGNQAGGVSMPNLSSASVPRPFFNIRSLSEIQENQGKNGKTNFCKSGATNHSAHISGLDIHAQIQEEEKEEVKINGASYHNIEGNEKVVLTQQPIRCRKYGGSLNRFQDHRNSMRNLYIQKRRSSTIAAPPPEAMGDEKEEENGSVVSGKRLLPNLDKIYKLDIFARTVFPFFYVVFNVAYFVYYAHT